MCLEWNDPWTAAGEPRWELLSGELTVLSTFDASLRLSRMPAVYSHIRRQLLRPGVQVLYNHCQYRNLEYKDLEMDRSVCSSATTHFLF
jgi:hypothetical protein